jgi:hypothetical protein
MINFFTHWITDAPFANATESAALRFMNIRDKNAFLRLVFLTSDRVIFRHKVLQNRLVPERPH